MLRDVFLYGHLAEKYGQRHRFSINSAPEAVRALAANYKPFTQDFRDGFYRVVVGDLQDGTELDLTTLDFQLGRAECVHIIPVVMGSKGGGGLKIIAGLALLAPFAYGFIGAAAFGGAPIGTAFATASETLFLNLGSLGAITYGNLASVGLSMLVSGISAMMTPVPKVGDYGARERPDQKASFLFNAPTNKSIEGHPVPLVFGQFKVGSLVASAGLSIEQLL